ncbi:hypothetical protein [Zooshikella ganghwensis]|uniref:hypothetical protein n=1 Tax=Zooshikella ganghwensis TaxID=202772 RepID=UPI00040003ED|nr:hypothetical protein [Zooshikella ganghwensis]
MGGKKSVETMVQQINEALEKKRGDRKPKIGVYGYGTTKRLVIAEQEFNDFIHKGEMDEILDKYISQAIVINNKINAKKQQNKSVP